MFFYKKNLRPYLKYQNAIQSNKIEDDTCFFNQTFDKGRLKIFVLWFLKKYGEHKTIELVEELKNIGFKYATKAGISLGIEDLKIPPKKYSLLMDAEQLSLSTIKQYKRGEITGVERFQRLIDTWHRTSERLKQEVIDNFEATDILNPVYMMAFSGARGNISQVRQLVGMRGLMSDPQGKIIDFPIRSNFREGLTLTEYIISSYGARKGIVDTALRTANAGYLTRRLVDVAQHVIISNFDCGTKRGIFLTDMKEGNKTIYSLQNRLIGRVLARDVYNNKKIKIASRNLEVSPDLSANIAFSNKKIFVRSTLTCQTKKLVCQLCYGWSLAQGNLVGIGEAVGVVAAQSIGEPGTQLTMRTFHTGGVFSGDVSDQIRAPFNGIVEYKNPIAGTLIRTPEGKIAFLTKNEGSFLVHRPDFSETKKFKIPFYTLLFLKNGSSTEEKEVIAQISSINRQINATDQAELTIKSEFSGQLYSKILDLKENKVGPKFKNLDKDRSTDLESDTFSKQFYENAIDTVFEAWGWGYAWVLSGKIYQLPFPSTFFPLFGDYVNRKTYMNQIYWNIPRSFGNSFQLNTLRSNFSKNKKEIKLMRLASAKKSKAYALRNRAIVNGKGKLFLRAKDSSENNTLINKKEVIVLKNEIISFQLSKIVYKKMGYLLKLSEPVFSFSNKSHDLKLDSTKSFNFKNYNNQTSILSAKDSLFLFSSLYKDKAFNSIDKNSSVYPATWKPSFDIFLNWFPKRLSTKTGGLMFIEPIFFGQESNIKRYFKTKNQVNFKTYSILNNNLINKKCNFQSIDNLLSYNNIPIKLSTLIMKHHLYKNITNKLYLSSKWQGSAVGLPTQPLEKLSYKKSKAFLAYALPGIISTDHNQSFSGNASDKLEGKANSNLIKKLKNNNIDFPNKKVKFFPTFLQRKNLMTVLPNLKSTQTKQYNAQLDKKSFTFPTESAEGKTSFAAPSDLLNLSRNGQLSQIQESEQLKSFFYFKKNDTSSQKSTSELSKNLILEQYKQNHFDTFFYTALNVNKNKTKTEIVSFGLPWKNVFKLNTNSFLNNKNSILNSKKEFKENLELHRIFWVSQPFYMISLKNSNKFYFKFFTKNKSFKENKTKINDFLTSQKNSLAFNKSEACLTSEVSRKVENFSKQGKSSTLGRKQSKLPKVFKSNRQGQITWFLCPEGYIQTNQNEYLLNDDESLKAGKKNFQEKQNFSYPDKFNTHDFQIIKTKLRRKTFKKSEFNTITLKKEGIYYFASFNNNILNDLKMRKTIFSSLLNEFNLSLTSDSNNEQVKKRIILKDNELNKRKLAFLSLKAFSKISSFPYLLNKNNINLLNKKLTKVSEFNSSEISKKQKKSSVLNLKTIKTFNLKSPDLFSFYFYSIFQKNFKKIKGFQNHFISFINKMNSKNLAKKLLNKQFKLICSPYLKDQLSFSLIDLVSSSFPCHRQKNFQLFSAMQAGSRKSNLFLESVSRISENKNMLALVQSDDINYQFKINYQEGCYSYSLNSFFEYPLNKEFLNIFLFPIPFKKLTLERVKSFQNGFKKAKFYKKMYLKTLLKMNKQLYNHQLKNNSNSRFEKPKLLKQKSKISYRRKSKWKADKKFYYFYRDNAHKGQNKIKKIDQTPKNQKLSKQNSYINIIIKPGWVYSTKTIESFLQYQKKLIHAGKKIGNDLLFESNSILVDFIPAKDITGFFNLINSDFNVINQNLFVQTIWNKKCRFPASSFLPRKAELMASYPGQNSANKKSFAFPSDARLYSLAHKHEGKEFRATTNESAATGGNLDFDNLSNVKSKNFFILFRKANEHKLFKEIQYKKEILKLSNKKNQGPCLINLNKNYKQMNLQSSLLLNVNQNIFLNKPFNSNNLLSSYKTGLVNKQKITAQCLSKYPSSNFKIISNSSIFKSISSGIPHRFLKARKFLKLSPKLTKLNESQHNYSNQKYNKSLNQIVALNSIFKKPSYTYLNLNKSSSFGFSSSSITLLKPINFLSFMISYKVPFSLDFPFKAPLHIFRESPIHIKQTSFSARKAQLMRSKFGNKVAEGKPITEFERNIALKIILKNYFFKIQLNLKNNLNSNTYEKYLFENSNLQKNKNELIGDININLGSFISCPIAEYSLGKELEKSISFPTNSVAPNNSKWKKFIENLNDVSHKPYLFKENGPVLGSLNHSLEANYKTIINKESLLYKTEFVCYKNKNVNLQLPFIKTYTYCSFEGELIYKNSKPFKYSKPDRFTFDSLIEQSKRLPTIPSSATQGYAAEGNSKKLIHSSKSKPINNKNSVVKKSSTNQSFSELFSNKSIDNSCMILTKKDQISFYFPFDLSKNMQNYKEIYFSLETLKKKNQYFINDVIIHFLNLSEEVKGDLNELPINISSDKNYNKDLIDSNLNNEFIFKINKLPTGMAQQKSKLLIGDFLVYGDQIGSNLAVPKSGQIVHLNNKKITLRQGQPIFVSPKSILHKYDGDFIDQQSPVITLSYQQLKTGDIIQGIPKVEQFFEARTTKRGRLFHDSLANLLKGLFKRYYSKLPLDQAVRQSFYKIQQIIVDGVQRVYRSQGVTIADKHLEVIVKQMTSKVRIIEGGQTGFFPGEVVDLEFVEQVNSLLMKKITYEPLVLGITKSSLEVDSFLSAASFQQTTRVLSKAAISRKKDFLRGLKENVILGNLIPAGTGYLVYLDQI